MSARPLSTDPFVARHSLLVSIRPEYAVPILDGSKTVELRRKAPTIAPGMVMIYGSGSMGSVVGSARLASIVTGTPETIWQRFGSEAKLNRDEFDAYFSGSDKASALLLEGVRRAATPLPLAELRLMGLEPPQSWRYIDSDQTNALEAAIKPIGDRSTPDISIRHRRLGDATGNLGPKLTHLVAAVNAQLSRFTDTPSAEPTIRRTTVEP